MATGSCSEAHTLTQSRAPGGNSHVVGSEYSPKHLAMKLGCWCFYISTSKQKHTLHAYIKNIQGGRDGSEIGDLRHSSPKHSGLSC